MVARLEMPRRAPGVRERRETAAPLARSRDLGHEPGSSWKRQRRESRPATINDEEGEQGSELVTASAEVLATAAAPGPRAFRYMLVF